MAACRALGDLPMQIRALPGRKRLKRIAQKPDLPKTPKPQRERTKEKDKLKVGEEIR